MVRSYRLPGALEASIPATPRGSQNIRVSPAASSRNRLTPSQLAAIRDAMQLFVADDASIATPVSGCGRRQGSFSTTATQSATPVPLSMRSPAHAASRRRLGSTCATSTSARPNITPLRLSRRTDLNRPPGPRSRPTPGAILLSCQRPSPSTHSYSPSPVPCSSSRGGRCPRRDDRTERRASACFAPAPARTSWSAFRR